MRLQKDLPHGIRLAAACLLELCNVHLGKATAAQTSAGPADAVKVCTTSNDAAVLSELQVLPTEGFRHARHLDVNDCRSCTCESILVHLQSIVQVLSGVFWEEAMEPRCIFTTNFVCPSFTRVLLPQGGGCPSQ